MPQLNSAHTLQRDPKDAENIITSYSFIVYQKYASRIKARQPV